ncbi:hypothetical protein ATO10_06846 [Actibacterium atlanticum]|uniref:Uncharacterized protein n=1 Tax=Actibacterium atlanticum TaxID=1461693 RepID=A0A058ZN42_9RHOB|nr:hypothetical protein [Actibacterium atlanticum]KCV82640.1 hypothetical protein ATO10_06846 [Actibacterium atlanticum]
MAEAYKLQIDTKASTEDTADVTFGGGVEGIDAPHTGPCTASGIYRDGDYIAADLTPAGDGVILSTGKAKDAANMNRAPYRGTDTADGDGPAAHGPPRRLETQALMGRVVG